MINPWVGSFGKISAELDQKCVYSINAYIFGQSQILGIQNAIKQKVRHFSCENQSRIGIEYL